MKGPKSNRQNLTMSTTTTARFTPEVQPVPPPPQPLTAEEKSQLSPAFCIVAEKLSLHERAGALPWLFAFTRIDEGAKSRRKMAVARREAETLGINHETLLSRYYRLKDGLAEGDYSPVLMGPQKRAGRVSSLPEAFLDFWERFVVYHVSKRKRSFNATHLLLLQLRRKWELEGSEDCAIPGYDAPPPARKFSKWGSFWHPFGWSNGHLRERFEKRRPGFLAKHSRYQRETKGGAK